MIVLVTGGAGFIGSHTVDALLDKGYEVRILDNLQEPVHQEGKPKYINTRAKFILGDVCNKETISECIQDVDYIFHFAAYQDYLPDFSTYFHVNTVGTALLFECIVEKSVPIKKVIVASTQAVMGEGKYSCPIHGNFYPDIRSYDQLARGDWEIHCSKCGKGLNKLSDESVVNPQNQYAMSKYSQEMLALNLGKRYDVPTVCLRYSIVQGPRQSFYYAYSGAMRIFSLAFHQDKRPIIFEDGEQIRDYVNIFDVVDANMLVLEKNEANYESYNVSGGKAITVNEFYDEVNDVYGADLKPICEGYFRYGDVRHIVSDISKLRDIGWEPKRGIRDSILSYKEYLESHDNVPNVLTSSIQEMKSRGIIRQALVKQ